MVEVLDKVIDRVRGGKQFKEFLADRFPKQAEVVMAPAPGSQQLKMACMV